MEASIEETNAELIEQVRNTEDRVELRKIADKVGVTYSGNSGVSSLKDKILEVIVTDGPEDEAEEDDDAALGNDPISQALLKQREEPEESIYEEDKKGTKLTKKFSIEEMLKMDAGKIADPILRKNVIKAQALRLVRVKINNLDPADVNVPGAIVALYSKYTGKVAKYIPYDEDQHPNGYHIPQMILDELLTRTFCLRKEIKTAGSSFGVKQYKTTFVKKFNIEILPPLTPEELAGLAQKQQAQGSIDRSK